MKLDERNLESIVTAMSSENDFRESQVSDTSSIRTKVDVLNLSEKGNSQEHVLQDSKCNLRTSLAWDSAFFTSPGILEPEELFPALTFRTLDNVVNVRGNEGHLISSSQPREFETISRDGNFTSRKSLAWDDRFFTSEGVLDHYELAMVNNGFKKCGSHLVPVMEDEVWRSMESNSTLDSEGFSLTRLELDLFEDMRASMPKSSTATPQKGEGSRTMMKAGPTHRRQSVNKHSSKKITRELPDASKIQLKEISPPSLKPPKAPEHANSISRGSTKRTSLGEKHVKLVSASEERLGKSKEPCLRASRYAIHSSNSQTLKPSISPDIIIGKSPNLRRKVKSQGLQKLPNPASVTPLAKTRASQMEVENSRRPALSQSTPPSLSYELTSSMDEWSSESSSTSAAQGFIRRKTTHGSSRLEINSSKDSDSESNNSNEVSANLSRKKYQKGSDYNVLREMKPSRLRMPSPKLGFFDAGNKLVLGESPGGTVVVQTANRKPRSAGSLRGSGNKLTGHRKRGGTPVSTMDRKRISNDKDGLDNGTKTSKSCGRILQGSNNQSLSAQVCPKLDFSIIDGGNKENVISIVGQIESLTKHVSCINLSSHLDIDFCENIKTN